MSFSGHESFTCKQFWLKKVFDFARLGTRFGDEMAVVELGVGKNMVASLRYWGKAFGILNEQDGITELAGFLFDDDGADPFVEDLGTAWLLHYYLIKTNRATVYSLFFNEFKKERIDFTKEHLHAFLKRKCEELYPYAYNSNTINTDIGVLFRNYVRPHKDDKLEIEEDFSGILIDLNLIKHYKIRIEEKMTSWYKVEQHDGVNLPYQIVLYSILHNYPNQRSITFRELQSGANSPGSIFGLTAEALYDKLQEITAANRHITYTETAGNQILQLGNKIQPQDILNEYYAR